MLFVVVLGAVTVGQLDQAVVVRQTGVRFPETPRTEVANGGKNDPIIDAVASHFPLLILQHIYIIFEGVIIKFQLFDFLVKIQRIQAGYYLVFVSVFTLFSHLLNFSNFL